MPAPTFETPSDLVRACCAGDPQAWNEFVARYIRLIGSVARRRGFGADDVADICQDVLLHVFRDLPKLNRPESLVGWLITVTYRTCLGRLQQRQHYDLPPEDELHGALDGIYEADVRIDVMSALNQLDTRSRDLMTALFFNGSLAGYSGVARRLQMPIGSIGPTRARCFKRLRQALATSAHAA